MPINLLSDVDVVAVSIVDKGANRKRFYLRKSHDHEDLLTLPSPHRLLKSADWTTVYCVVAEPGWRENAGSGSPGETNEDQWASEDEIRLAAHRFMKNGALVNKMHETLDPYGTVVENFIAQADFEMDGELILKGSWIIGIHPSEEGKAKIESGEFTGVSIQGTGIRQLAKASGSEGPKAKKCPRCGGTVSTARKTCQNCGYSFSIQKLDLDAIEKVSSRAYPGLERKGGRRDNWIEAVGGLPDFIERIAKHLHYEQGMSISRAIATAISRCKVWARGGGGVSAKTQAKAAKAIAEWNAKKAKAKGLRLRKALDDIEEGVEPDDANVRDEAMTNDETPVTMGWLRKAFGLGASAENTPEEEVVSEAATQMEPAVSKEEFISLKDTVEKSAKSVEALAARIADIAQALAEGKKEEKPPTTEEVYHRLDELTETITKSLDEVRADVEKLGAGDTAQRQSTTVTKQNDHPLAGLLD